MGIVLQRFKNNVSYFFSFLFLEFLSYMRTLRFHHVPAPTSSNTAAWSEVLYGSNYDALAASSIVS